MNAIGWIEQAQRLAAVELPLSHFELAGVGATPGDLYRHFLAGAGFDSELPNQVVDRDVVIREGVLLDLLPVESCRESAGEQEDKQRGVGGLHGVAPRGKCDLDGSRAEKVARAGRTEGQADGRTGGRKDGGPK